MRYALGIAGFLSIIFAPLYLTAVLAILLSIRYQAWEVLCMGLLIDLLWSPHDGSFFSYPIATLTAIIIVWGFEPLRRELLQ